MARGFDSVKGFDNKDSLKETDLFDVLALAKAATGNWVSLRFLPIDNLPIKKHWIRIMGGKDKEKLIKVPRMCTSFDPDNEDKPLKGRACPYCKIEHGNDESGLPAQLDFKYWFQAIVRDEQESKPRKIPKHTKSEQKTGKKDVSSDSWTPVKMVALTPAVARKIREMGERNFGKDKKTAYSVTDKKYGIDVSIKYNPKAAPADRYVLDKGERTPLTKEELEYLTWATDDYAEVYDLMGRLDTEGSLADYKKLDIEGATSVNDEDDEDEDDVPTKGKKSKSKKRPSMLDDDEDDDDEDDIPLKKKKKKSDDDKPKKKKKKSDDDEDDDLPKRKKKKKSDDDEDKPKKKKKK